MIPTVASLLSFAVFEPTSEVTSATIHIIAQAQPEAVNDYAQSMRRLEDDGRPAAVIIALLGEDPVGVAVLTQSTMTHDLGELAWVNVHPTFRRQGIGREMVRYALQTAAEHGWSVILATSSPEFYIRCGLDTAAPLTQNRWLIIAAAGSLDRAVTPSTASQTAS
jgi:predicted N-acetyltransferase YhbS